jgi:hypothetical protein
MKTVPTLRVVSKADALAEVEELGVDDLPAEVRLGLGAIAGVAREGLLAMSVAARVLRSFFLSDGAFNFDADFLRVASMTIGMTSAPKASEANFAAPLTLATRSASSSSSV